MEKIAPLKSADVPKEFSIFKLHLSCFEKGWTGEKVTTETYRSTNGRIFSLICHLDEMDKTTRTDLLIDDEASLEEIDELLDEVLSEINIGNLGWLYQVNLQSRNFDYVIKSIEGRIGGKHKQNPEKFDHFMFLAPLSMQDEIAVPQGYILDPLSECHAQPISVQWAIDIDFGHAPHLTGFVLKNIRERPCFGIFTDTTSKELVAWLCFYSGGAAGMLHVRDGHRGKGLARVLLKHTLEVVREVHGEECRVHACVKKDNTASFKLFKSEGWELQPVNYKKMFFCIPGKE